MEQFLKTFINKETHNYTKIGSKPLNISGGAYYIPEEDIDTFYRLYKQNTKLFLERITTINEGYIKE
jgi:hypothetical protein